MNTKNTLVIVVVIITGLAVFAIGVYVWLPQRKVVQEQPDMATADPLRDVVIPKDVVVPKEDQNEEYPFLVRLELIHSADDLNIYRVRGSDFSFTFSTPQRFLLQLGEKYPQDPNRVNFQYYDKTEGVNFTIGVGLLPQFSSGELKYDFAKKRICNELNLDPDTSCLSPDGFLGNGLPYYHFWRGEHRSYGEYYAVVNEAQNLAVLASIGLFDGTDYGNAYFTQEELDQQTEAFLEGKKRFSEELLAIVKSISFAE